MPSKREIEAAAKELEKLLFPWTLGSIALLKIAKAMLKAAEVERKKTGT